jgi:Predicted membrane protein (DUF2078).
MAEAMDRIRDNLTEVVSVMVTGIWLLGLVTGQDWWLPAMLLGYIVVVPFTALMYGDQDTIEEYWEDEEVSVSEETDTEDPVETLKRRYAAGEIGDEEFERKLERLLETETPETRPKDEIDRELDRS